MRPILWAGAVPGTALGAWNLVAAVTRGIEPRPIQAHAILQIGAFAFPLALALGGRARTARAISAGFLLLGAFWLLAGPSVPPRAFDPIWHLGLFAVVLPMTMARIDLPLPSWILAGYGLGVAVTAVGLALPPPARDPLVQAGRATFALALLFRALDRRARVRAAGPWIAAASIATVVNAARELSGGPPGDALVSDAVRHAYAIGGVSLPLLVLAAPRAERAIVALSSLAVTLRLFVIPLAYGPHGLVALARPLVAASGVLGTIAVAVAIARAVRVDTPEANR